ncbi:MAG: hypothetical protein P3A28_03740 [Gemmatimonadota bacterium]|nr:hypothetical protein [Gemmatimonadota bacterium]
MKFVLVVALWGAPPQRPPQPRDSWFGRDKMLHCVVSAAVQGAAHTALRAGGADYRTASRTAGAVTLTVGISKELWDRKRGGDPSLKDLAWDGIGGTLGAVSLRQIDK